MNNKINNQSLIEKIKAILQNIQDKTEPQPELGNFDMREHKLYWKLGTLIKQYIDSNQLSEEQTDYLISKTLKNIEKEIRSVGKREGKTVFPTWIMENKQTKQFKPPEKTWVKLSLQFVEHFQDEERWDLVANLSGHRFKNEKNQTLFTRKFAEDLLRPFSKKEPPENAKELQKIFIDEIAKFDHKPKRESEWEPLKRQIFGEAKLEVITAEESFDALDAQVDEVIDEKNGTPEARKELLESIGENQISNLRSLLRLIRISDKERFEQKLKKVKLSKSFSSKHAEAKRLYHSLYPLLKDIKSREKLLKRVTSVQLTSLNTKLKAISTENDYNEYLENEKLRKDFFS